MTVKLVLHFSTNTIYELHRDAFMYIDLGNHLAWGYHSVPPSIAVFANLSRFLMGDNTFAIRFFPAIIGVLSMLLIGIMVREAGGGNRAQFFALLAFLLAPAFLRSNSLFQPVSFDQFYWLLLAFLLFRLIRTGRKHYWYLIGFVAGLAFLNKYAVVFCLAGILVGVLSTPLKKWLGTPHPWIAAGIALLIAFPNLLWQYRNNWPVVNHMQELARTQLVNVRIGVFLLDQVMMFMPVVFVWILGLVQVAFLREGRPYRAFAWIYLTVILLLILLRGKSYYTIGAYSVLFVFGGLFIEARLKGKLAWIRYVFILHAVIATALSVPLSLPVLKPEAFIKFYRGTPMEHSQRWEDGQYYDLPQDYADMIGWRELAGIVGRTYDSLSPGERSRCVIFSNNYGEAGAVNFYGTPYGLPPVISYNDSYLFWAPDSIDADYFIKVGQDDNLRNLFENVRILGRISTPYARQQGTPVYFCYGQKVDVDRYYREELRERRNRYRASSGTE
jgi:4-amino-4-deoxy-L-arabinose transferase-like glycosyltransferase